MATIKALPIDVYRHGTDDFTNGGATSRHDDIYVATPLGFCNIEESDERLFKVGIRRLGQREYKFLEPYKSCPDGTVGWMDGGNVAYTYDDRFPSEYPLCIHDRCETYGQYDSLSR